MAKASDNPYPSLLLVEQAAAPATPPAGQARLYRGSDNTLHMIDDAGAVVVVGGSSGGAGETAWTAPTLTNSWVNTDPTFSPAGYRKDGSGVVHLRGLVKGGALGSVMFTLPAGYRPAYHTVYPVVANSAFGQVNVKSDGTVALNVGSAAGSTTLDGISFYTD